VDRRATQVMVVAQGSVDVAAVGGNGTIALVALYHAHRLAKQHLPDKEGHQLA